MHNVLILFWISQLTSYMRTFHGSFNPRTDWIWITIQMACLILGMVEVGSINANKSANAARKTMGIIIVSAFLFYCTISL